MPSLARAGAFIMPLAQVARPAAACSRRIWVTAATLHAKLVEGVSEHSGLGAGTLRGVNDGTIAKV